MIITARPKIRILVRTTQLLGLAWREARPTVQVIFLLRFFAGMTLRCSGFRSSAITAAAAWLAATWAIYLLNGVADVVEDRENRSARPIALGRLPVTTAARITWSLAIVALGLAALTSLTMLLLVALMLAVGWGYSMGPFPFKRSVPAFALSVFALGLLTYFAGWYASGTEAPNRSVVLFGTMMSVWMALAGSSKDLSDTRGDRAAGRRTLPVLLGERPTRSIIAAATCLVGATFVVVDAVWLRQLLPAAIVVAAGAVVLAIVALTPLGTGDRHAKRRPYRIFMITQYLTHVTLFSIFIFVV